MFFKIVGIVFVFFVVVVFVAIVIYTNSKSNKKTSTHTESFLQFNGNETSLDSIINYSNTKYDNVSLIVLHHHKPPRALNQYLLVGSNNLRLKSMYHIMLLPAHTILLNKNVYNIDDLTTYKNENSYLTSLRISDIHFPHITRSVYVGTIKFKDSYFDDVTYSEVASMFEFVHKDVNNSAHPIIIADFACQNWNYLNRDWQYSTGKFNCITHVDDRGCVSRHGFLFGSALKCAFAVDQVTDINIDSPLIVRLEIQNYNNKCGSLSLDTNTEKMNMSQKYRDLVNFTKSKTIADKQNIVLREYSEFKPKRQYKFVTLETLVNRLYKLNNENNN